MIRITVELIKAPYGLEKEILGVMNITNDGSGGKTYGNYRFDIHARKLRIKSGRVLRFKRDKTVWWLIYHCLKLAFWENKKLGELSSNVPQVFGRVE